MKNIAELVQLEDREEIRRFVESKRVDFVVIGPEAILAADIAGYLRMTVGVPVFGPDARQARIETSKIYAKELMKKARIPTAPFVVYEPDSPPFTPDFAPHIPPPWVVKADGLASGKGVEIYETVEEVNAAIRRMRRRFGDSARTILIERFFEGQEVSFHLFSDGTGLYLPFPASCDYKKLGRVNTGGMGAIAPTTALVAKDLLGMTSKIFTPLFDVLRDDTGEGFPGCMYPGMMLTKSGPVVIEVNARPGDPEMPVYMRLYKSDLEELLYACATGRLKEIRSPEWHPGYAVSVVLATQGYPKHPPKRAERITGIQDAESVDGVVAFHAGTKYEDGHYYATGGRALNITAVADTFPESIERAYEAVKHIQLKGMQYRTNIGHDLIGKI